VGSFLVDPSKKVLGGVVLRGGITYPYVVFENDIVRKGVLIIVF
jgi:hypothetical protein